MPKSKHRKPKGSSGNGSASRRQPSRPPPHPIASPLPTPAQAPPVAN